MLPRELLDIAELRLNPPPLLPKALRLPPDDMLRLETRSGLLERLVGLLAFERLLLLRSEGRFVERSDGRFVDRSDCRFD